MAAEQTLIEQDIEITSAVTGRKEKAKLIKCPDCGGALWGIILIGPHRHHHMQCANCGACYCDGQCAIGRN